MAFVVGVKLVRVLFRNQRRTHDLLPAEPPAAGHLGQRSGLVGDP
jgi:hypothetical protein